MVIDQSLLGRHKLGVKYHLRSLPGPNKLGSNEQNQLYLNLWLIEQVHTKYAETTLVLQLIKGGFDLRGQSS